MTLVLSGDSPSFSGTFQGGTLTLGTAQNTTSGTAIDFTGIPSWVKRITVMLNGVSLNGASNIVIRLGSGTVQSTGYVSNQNTTGASGHPASSTTEFLINTSTGAAYATYGTAVFTLLTGNTWCLSATGGDTQPNGFTAGGAVTLSGVLDRLRLTTTNGTDLFDAGTVNILYEG